MIDNFRRLLVSGLVLITVVATGDVSKADSFSSEMVFDPDAGPHGHVHASCVVECPNRDLLVVWYENGAALPEHYFNKDQDKSDNVRIGAARRRADARQFESPFVIADSFGLSDNNPCLVVDREKHLWLIRPTLLGVPDWSWGSALVRYQISSDFLGSGEPKWHKQDILVPHVKDLKQTVETMVEQLASQSPQDSPRLARIKESLGLRMKEPLITRLGWMPRAHPLIRSDGAILIPLSNENFNLAVMAISKDRGATWEFSKPVPELGLTQPTVVEYSDGKMSAFFRNGSAEHRIKRSDSEDGGMTWSLVKLTTLPHPGAGIEACLLKNGHLAMVYNDKESGPRDRLAISISKDRGETWTATRRLEDIPDGRFDYPSIIQSEDGTIHVTYSYNLKTIKHVWFDEDWATKQP